MQKHTRQIFTRTLYKPSSVPSPPLFAIGLLVALAGCDQRSIEEHVVAKGVERVPAVEATSPAPHGDSGPDVIVPESPWIVPEGWTLDPEPRQMRLATYIAPDPSGPVEVAVSRFAGRVGGELANINRWRGQLRLAPIGASELESTVHRFTSPGFEGYETRIDAPGGIMLAVAVYEARIDQTWFVRATVPDGATADRLQERLFAMGRSIMLVDKKDDE